jgi:hypothetical protein
VNNIEIGENFGNSDHQIIRFRAKANYISASNNKVLNYSKGDYNKALLLARKVNWDLLILNNVEEGWTNFKRTVIDITNKCIPLVNKKKSKCKWVTHKVIRARRGKCKAWKKYCKTKTNENYKKYKIKRNLSQKINRIAQLNYEAKLAKNIKTDSKSFFSYVNNKKKLGIKIGPLKDQNCKFITDDVEMANFINNYFSTVFVKENNSNAPQINPHPVYQDNEPLSSINITETQVLEKLQNLKINKSPGPDGIHPKLLYELRYVLVKPLTTLFKLSLKSAVIPNDWTFVYF